MTRLITTLVALLLLALPLRVTAQEVARLQLDSSSIIETDYGWSWPWSKTNPLELQLTLDQPVPYRAFLVADPVRLIVDLKYTDLNGLQADDLRGNNLVPAIRWGQLKRDWSRIVMELPGPYRIESAGQQTGQAQAKIVIDLRPVNKSDFSPLPSASAALQILPEPADLPDNPKATESEQLTVMLDPGHGGFDPGAQDNGETEADLVLTYALELHDKLEAAGVNVVMTRDDDSFVGLEARMTAAREAGADLFLSLHADALPSGQAAGATVYVWNSQADHRASERLATVHDRDDLLSGIDLTGKDDALAAAIMDFARTDTQPRSQNFASFLTSRMALMGIGLHGRAVQNAAFSVLKSPDIPSVLLELGYLTDAEDRANLTNPLWRERMVQVMAEAIIGWARDEQARQGGLLR